MGAKSQLLNKKINRAHTYGRRFRKGSHAEQLKWTRLSNALNRAVECWRSNTVPIVAEAKKMALAFLAEVSADYLAGPAFALTICRRILNEFEDRMCRFASHGFRSRQL